MGAHSSLPWSHFTSDKVRVLPTLWEVGPLNNNFKGAGVLFVSFGCFGCGCLGSWGQVNLGLVIVEFKKLQKKQNKECEVLYGYMKYVFHKSFDFLRGYFEFFYNFEWLFVCGSS